jgi:hypothetical protein
MLVTCNLDGSSRIEHWDISNRSDTSFAVNVFQSSSPTWAGFERTQDGWIDTGDWLSFINVDALPWGYSSALDAWIYFHLTNGLDSPSGWVYIPK